ncbi:MAG: redoxin domain-containing protein [Marinifilaceae bacterium]|nr:redoxin domain-containing protein [Marinifilaceae bacterium]
MKKLLLFTIIAFLLSSCMTEIKTCYLKANFEKDINGELLFYKDIPRHALTYRTPKPDRVIKIKNGIINDSLSGPTYLCTGTLRLGDHTYYVSFFNEPGNLRLSIHNGKIIPSGTPMNDEFNEKYLDQIRDFIYETDNENRNKIIDKLIDDIWKDLNAKSDSYVLSSIAYSYVFMKDIQTLNKLINSFSPNLYESPYLKFFREYRKKAIACSEGKIAPDFTYKTLDNKPISLSDFKGHDLILSYSTTNLYRYSGPGKEILQAYNSFNKQGLRVLDIKEYNVKDKDLGVYLKKNNFPWLTLKDDGSMFYNYFINQWPIFILINKEGRIVSRFTNVNFLWSELTKLGYIR